MRSEKIILILFSRIIGLTHTKEDNATQWTSGSISGLSFATWANASLLQGFCPGIFAPSRSCIFRTPRILSVLVLTDQKKGWSRIHFCFTSCAQSRAMTELLGAWILMSSSHLVQMERGTSRLANLCSTKVWSFGALIFNVNILIKSTSREFFSIPLLVTLIMEYGAVCWDPCRSENIKRFAIVA